MQRIRPFLWFDDQAEGAAKLYASAFDNSKIKSISYYGDAGPGPKDGVMTVDFQLEGQDFTALNGGPQFRFTPATSLFVSCRTEREVDALWKKLSQGGKVLMELAKYPFSAKFGWVDDRFGLSWQVNLGGRAKTIVPFLMFVGEQNGKAEEALKFYTSLFDGSRIEQIERYGAGERGPEGGVKHGRVSLGGQELMAMDGGTDHAFTFTPAMSLYVPCETQREVDTLWDGLTAGGKPGQCGWLTDRYGVSWQVAPTVLGELIGDGKSERSKKVMQAMLGMTKFDIEGLRQAYAQ